MSEKSHTEIDRLIDLLAEKSILGLSEPQEVELRELQKEYGPTDENTFDLAVAAYDLAFGHRHQLTLPADVRQRILSQAPLHLPAIPSEPSRPTPNETTRTDDSRTTPTIHPLPLGEGRVREIKKSAFTLEKSASGLREMSSRASHAKRIFFSPFTWRETVIVLVAAASVLIAVFTWQNRTEISTPIVSAADQRAALLDAKPQDLVRVQWKPSTETDPIGSQVDGDVIWSDARQQGFMRFAGLPVNDPTQQQYQLWIFDADRDQRYPVDGGVFDIASNADEAVIPIQAKIHVSQATLFAVTIEKSGGVVVSDRQRLPLLAQVER